MKVRLPRENKRQSDGRGKKLKTRQCSMKVVVAEGEGDRREGNSGLIQYRHPFVTPIDFDPEPRSRFVTVDVQGWQ
jgi:hypothetical protein